MIEIINKHITLKTLNEVSSMKSPSVNPMLGLPKRCIV